jgi:hypothetical protein
MMLLGPDRFCRMNPTLLDRSVNRTRVNDLDPNLIADTKMLLPYPRDVFFAGEASDFHKQICPPISRYPINNRR